MLTLEQSYLILKNRMIKILQGPKLHICESTRTKIFKAFTVHKGCHILVYFS